MPSGGARKTKKPFALRADGWFHTSDVRAVASLPRSKISLFSASRDGTAAFLEIPPKTKDDLVVCRTFIGHTDFVNFIFYHPGLALIGGDACVVSGSNDHHVAVWDLETAKVRAVLDGHTKGVCHGTFVGPTHAAGEDDPAQGDIVTGDWGGVCHVYDYATGRIKLSYTQHLTAIRGIAHLPSTCLVVSASGDKSLHAWDVVTGMTRQVFIGHDDVVQCVCAVSASVFASGSNDCTVRLWKLGQEVALCVLNGHDSIIYSLAYSTVTDEVYSASEDHTVRVWSVTEVVSGKSSLDRASSTSRYSPVEVIYHPCVVWGLATLPVTGDLATGGSDGCVRIWTRNEDFIANPEKIVLLNESISAQSVDVKLTGLDAYDFGGSGAPDNIKVVPMDVIHQKRGRYEGEKLFVKDKGGEVGVYMWGSDRWDKVGTVVAGPDQAAYTGEPVAREKKIHEGKSYDYLFDVEVEGRMLKLGYNVGDNILESAQRFINEHSGIVSQDSREDIQNFLLKHISEGDLRQAPGIGGGTASNTAGTLPRGKSDRFHMDGHPETSYETSDVPVEPYAFPEVFGKFNAKGAKCKVNEFLQRIASSGLTSSLESFNQIMDGIQESHTLSNDEMRLFCQRLCEMGQILPEGCRFPLLDAIRFLFYQQLVHQGSEMSIPIAMGILLDSFEVLLMAPNDILTGENVSTNDAEMLVSLRLMCNVFAVLTKFSCDISSAHKALLMIAMQRLTFLALQKLNNTNIKISLVSLMINTSLYLTTVAEQRSLTKDNTIGEDSGTSTHTTSQLAGLLVTVAAKFLLYEPIGSAFTLQVLRALYTLFYLGKSIQEKERKQSNAHQKVGPIWFDDACKTGRLALQYTLHSIETGSNTEAKPIGEKIKMILGL